MRRLNALMHGVLLRLFRLLTCREVETFAYDFLEGRLDAGTALKLERHLKACPRCQAFLKTYRKTKELGSHFSPPPLDPEFKKELVTFLLAKLC